MYTVKIFYRNLPKHEIQFNKIETQIYENLVTFQNIQNYRIKIKLLNIPIHASENSVVIRMKYHSDNNNFITHCIFN